MRTILYLIISSCAFAACTSGKSFFISPNNVNKTQGTIYMQDGTTKKGIITISFENEHEKDNEILIKGNNDTVSEKVDVKKIKSYTIDGRIYVVKIINVRLIGEYHYLFVERLTAENDKMQLYRLPPSVNTMVAGEEPYYYYISFPQFDKYEVIDINSEKLVPSFEYKMSAYLKDCPDLQAKVQAKENKYFYATLSVGAKRIDVIKTIVKEYNECK